MTFTLFLLGMKGKHEGERFPLRPDFKDTAGLGKLTVKDTRGRTVTLTARKDGTLRVKGSDEFALGKEVSGRSGLVGRNLSFLDAS